MMRDTIFALSSGQGRAAIAVVRLSGPHVGFVVETFLQKRLEPRRATVVSLQDPHSRTIVDKCVALLFPGPASVTGEDVLELHLHGGVGVVRSVVSVLGGFQHLRLADPGEFTRRGLENGKFDVLQVEALGDLLNAETSAQVAQAQRQLAGELGVMVARWRQQLVEARSLIEAELDFSDEGDVGAGLLNEAKARSAAILVEVKRVLGHAVRGERVRDGASVVVMGAPNVGKSMLMNALAARDVSIVSDVAGTTRDALETVIDVDGWPVVLVDTAGLREAVDKVEQEGVRRALARAREADIVLSVSAFDVGGVEVVAEHARMIKVGTKCDLGETADVDVQVSGLTGAGLDELRKLMANALREGLPDEPALIARQRQREVMGEVAEALERAQNSVLGELCADDLRAASVSLGRLVGQTDIETVLDHLFRGFCIGK